MPQHGNDEYMQTIRFSLQEGSGTGVLTDNRDIPMPPPRPKMVCEIWGVRSTYRMTAAGILWDFFLSLDPDDAFTDTFFNSAIFWADFHIINTGGSSGPYHDTTMFPQPFLCPYTKIRGRFQRTTDAASMEWHLNIYYRFRVATAKEIAIAVLRRGRAESRRVP